MWLDPPSSNKTGVAIGGIVKETKLGKTLIEDDEGKVGIGVPPKIPPYGTQALTHPYHQGNPFIPLGRIEYSGSCLDERTCLP